MGNANIITDRGHFEDFVVLCVLQELNKPSWRSFPPPVNFVVSKSSRQNLTIGFVVYAKFGNKSPSVGCGDIAAIWS